MPATKPRVQLQVPATIINISGMRSLWSLKHVLFHSINCHLSSTRFPLCLSSPCFVPIPSLVRSPTGGKPAALEYPDIRRTPRPPCGSPSPIRLILFFRTLLLFSSHLSGVKLLPSPKSHDGQLSQWTPSKPVESHPSAYIYKSIGRNDRDSGVLGKQARTMASICHASNPRH